MEQYLNMISIPIITIIVYWIITIIKTAVNNCEKFHRFIPLTACVLGIACGIIAFYTVSDFLPTKNIVVAMVLGGASGLSATGTNQIIKQMTKDK